MAFKSLFLILAAGLLFSADLSAQNKKKNGAGNTVYGANNAWGQGSTYPDSCLNRTLSIAVHMCMDSAQYVTAEVAIAAQTDLDNAIEELNLDFAPICLKFKVCRLDTIYNYKYTKLDIKGNLKEEEEVAVRYNVKNMINLYVVKSTTGGDVGGWAETAPVTGNDTLNIIAIEKSSLTDKKGLSHLMGLFLGLLHTHETQFGAERSNGNYGTTGLTCATAGDLVCDTPADEAALEFHALNPCLLIENTAKDPNGDWYTPIIGNLMSHHAAPCKSKPGFTVGQYNRVVTTYLTYRAYLY